MVNGADACPSFPGFRFVQGRDADRMDLREIRDLRLAATSCMNDGDCWMFNAAGWLKNVPLEKSAPNGQVHPCDGLYVKGEWAASAVRAVLLSH